jgi:AmmeMemoRadiSam system protein B/AmmeMemoRadiSam system protein A
MDRERTPAETLLAAHEIAVRTGLKYAYVGNVHSPKEQTTYCPNCRRPLIERVGYDVRRYDLDGNGCRHCRTTIAGHYGASPGSWGSRRQPVRISQFQTKGSGVNCGSDQPLGRTQPQLTPDPLSIDSLTAEHERDILRTASRLVTSAVLGAPDAPRPDELVGVANLPVLGAFVTLKRRGKLRSCCGFLGQDVPLAQALAAAARRAAGEDPRFPPIAARELVHLEVDVWLLHRLTPVTARGFARRDAIEIGRHGLQIARGQSRGLLLPGVAVENGLSAEAFLEHVSMKAELPPTAWREDDTLLWTFEGRSIDGTLQLAEPVAADSARFTSADLAGLAEFCAGNLQALEFGATPNYFAPGLPDENVYGVAITLVDREGHELVQANRLSLKGSLPLQSTLFSLTQSMAQAIDRLRLPAEARRQCRPLVTILTEPAMHGTAAEPDLRGVDSQRHLLVVVQRSNSAAIYDPALTPSELLCAAVADCQVSLPAAAQVYSLSAWSNAPRLRIAHVPRPVGGQAVRPAAQAGRFYPAEPRELAELVERSLQGPSVLTKPWPAAMVPHAGLMYSGRIAAQTLRRIAFPQTVIVLGPKHTPRGVEWAIAPHEAWSIPGATLPADPQLARQLVEAIPGLALDAAAHAQEHAIEVELPLLARLAPRAKVVGIAIGAADLAGCRRFAAGLASVINAMSKPPLLLISSDMNHFASDAENRRLDDLALAAMQSLDPEQLYNTVTRHHVSMCGVLPAVIVMEALKQLGRLHTIERVAYATSGDVSGDRSRVVGYAGMLLG